MFLSRLILNPGSRRVQREAAEPYQMHRSILRAFPASLSEVEERVLFRLDAVPLGGDLALLVQSCTAPNWSWLAEPAARGYLLPGRTPNPAVKAFDLRLAAGQVLSFRLRANPTVRRAFEGGAHKRVGIYGAAAQLEWLRRKSAEGGFRVLSAVCGGEDLVGGTAGRGDERHELNLLAVQFDGRLQVTDPGRLCETVRLGIGSGKGFGFGLLSLAR